MSKGNPNWIAKRLEREAREAGLSQSDVEVQDEQKPSMRDMVVKDRILQFGTGPHGWSEIVHHVTDRGVYCRPNMHHEPDLSVCTFYSWEEIETLTTETA